MKTADAVKYFGSKSALADVIKVRPQAVQRWGETVPEKYAPLLAVASRGSIPVAVSDLKAWELVAESHRAAILLSTTARGKGKK